MSPNKVKIYTPGEDTATSLWHISGDKLIFTDEIEDSVSDTVSFVLSGTTLILTDTSSDQIRFTLIKNGGVIDTTKIDTTKIDTTKIDTTGMINDTRLFGTWATSMVDDESDVSITTMFSSPDKMTVTFKYNAIFDGTTMLSGAELDAFLAEWGLENPMVMTGTWKTSGSTLVTIMEGEADSSTYSISGTKLTITDSLGEPTVFTKK